MRIAWSALFVSVCIAAFGCSDGSTASSSGAAGGSGGAPACLPGQAIDTAGICFGTGIPTCADVFRGADGICRPSREACAPGERPDIVAGCVPVGVKNCAPEHLGADGICRPAREHCPAGQLPLPVSGCVSLDGPDGCGDAPFGNIPDEPPNVYVDASAPPGGNGLLQTPFNTIAQAMLVVPHGGRIVLAAGSYPEALEITRPVEIRGRCASMTHIEGSGANPAIRIAYAGSVALRDLSVTSPSHGILLEGVQSTTIERVRIHDTVEFALYSSSVSGSVGLNHVLIEGTKKVPPVDLAAFAGGVYLRGSAKVQIHASAVVDNGAGGVILDSGVFGDIRDSLIADNEGLSPDSVTNSGLYVRYSAAEMHDSAILRNQRFGIVSGGSDVAIFDSVIADTRPNALNLAMGHGVAAVEYGSFELHSSVLANNGDVGMIGQLGTPITVEDSMIVDTRGTESGGKFGLGVAVNEVSVVMRRSVIAGNRTAGMGIWGGKADVSETIVENTLPQQSDQLFGRGIQVTDSGALTLSSVVLWKNHEAGLMSSASSAVTMSDCLIANTLPMEANGEQGFGVFAGSYSTLKMTRSLVENNRVAGIVASWSTAELSDLWVHSVLAGKFTLKNPTQTFENVGDGIIATHESVVNMSRVVVEDTARAGLLWDDSSGNLTNGISRGNRFGIVLQGTLRPTYSPESLVLTPNSEAEQLEDGALAVPAEPAKLPGG